AGSDVVTLHLPLTDETHELIDARALSLMKPSALLVNVSRGGLVEEAALAQALHEGRLAGAGLDVLATEPPPADHVLLNAPNVLLSPHFAWYSTGSEQRVWTDTVDGMLAVLGERAPGSGRVAVEGTAVSR
ncbi:MAG TPA: NAD(P)-dependent oxidoreductase, partial [Conexibacter sp.]|nr:NAD(P)-dependent oxidoreductase [Conexibacter sp.]